MATKSLAEAEEVVAKTTAARKAQEECESVALVSRRMRRVVSEE
jgi:hypothetical protein|tara:strand:+ start:703 stop:834 length:132 start_codon:yes stop_codon:yes gene_type:complete